MQLRAQCARAKSKNKNVLPLTQPSAIHLHLVSLPFSLKISLRSKKFEVCLKTVRLNQYVNCKELPSMLLYTLALIFM